MTVSTLFGASEAAVGVEPVVVVVVVGCIGVATYSGEKTRRGDAVVQCSKPKQKKKHAAVRRVQGV